MNSLLKELHEMGFTGVTAGDVLEFEQGFSQKIYDIITVDLGLSEEDYNDIVDSGMNIRTAIEYIKNRKLKPVGKYAVKRKEVVPKKRG